MPEYPDIEVYLECLESRIGGQMLRRASVFSPFVLRSANPPISSLEGQCVIELRRLGKRVVIGFESDLWLVIHLMIAGRFHWVDAVPRRTKQLLAAFEFDTGSLTLTEAGTKKRASMHVVEGQEGLAAHDPGGLEVMDACFQSFHQALQREKRALTDPRIFSGIGNAYSDEILHRAGLSPVTLTRRLEEPAQRRLYEACQEVLDEWRQRLRAEAGDGFPEKVTAFRKEMAVHGRFGKACPTCGGTVQRIRYADNETNYCPQCQTEGKLLADRSLSALLKKDWPRSVEELEALRTHA